MPKKNKTKKNEHKNITNNSLNEIEYVTSLISEKITYLQILNDGTICSGTELGNIYIYNQYNYVEIIKISEHIDYIFYIIQLKNGNILSTSRDNTIKIIKLNNFHFITYLIIKVFYNDDYAHKILELDDKKLICSFNKGMIKIYEPIDNNNNICYQEQLILKYEKLYESFAAIKNKNLLILGCSKEDFIRIIDLIEYKNIKKIGKIYNCRLVDVICQLNDKYFIIGGVDVIYLIQISNLKIVQEIKTQTYFSKCILLKNQTLLTLDFSMEFKGQLINWKLKNGKLEIIGEKKGIIKNWSSSIIPFNDNKIAIGEINGIKIWKISNI